MAGRLQGLCRLARFANQRAAQVQTVSSSAAASSQQEPFQLAPGGLMRSLQQLSRSFASSAPTTDVAAEYEHATGLEKCDRCHPLCLFAGALLCDLYVGATCHADKEEIEASMKGKLDPWHEDWLDAPFGTAEAPVQVPSAFSHRVVGVPDPDDDSLVWWGIIEAGEPPKQIIEGGEYFVLTKDPDADESHGHH